MDINKPRNQAEQLIQAGLKKIARDLARIDKRVNIIERASQSKFRSVSGGSTYYYDTDGNVRQVLGAQEDGTYTVTDVNGPPPDQAPSAPILETRDATLIVTWDGKMANGSTLWPADFSHVEVHVSTEDNFAVSDDTEISSLHGKIGESVSISLVGSTEYYVRLAAVNTSGNRSAASADVSVIVEDIETGIKTFRQDDAPTGLDSDNYGYLWYDTNDGNKLYFWDGVAWVETTDASVAEASTLASTAYDLADDAFTAAQAAQASADGAIRTYYASDPPWANGSSQPADVLGDMWFDEDDGQAYRWNGSSWVIIEDSSIAVALAAAQNAQTTADGKITAYYQDTAPTVGDLGDLWYDTNDQNKPYYCSSISPLTWTLIRDAGITTAQATADQAVADAADAQATADGKTRSYFQTTAPTGLTAADVGDMWFDSDDGFKMYRWDGDSWEVSADTRISDALTAANNAQTIANGKITTFYQTSPPVSTAIGDLWVDTDDGNKLYRALMVGADAIAGGEWVSVQDTGIASAAAAAAAASATAAAAQSDADQALADAADAQATADGKMRTFFQAAAPTGMVAGDIGDLWFDTDDGNKLYRWDGSAWVVSQDQALAAELEAYIQSRGTDLVTNGTGLLGNNTNFSWSTFRADDAPVGASGSFMSSFGGQVRFTDEVIPVDPAKKYVLSAWVRETTTETDSRAYTGFAPYDAYGLSINPQHYMFRGGTTTTLAAPLNPGDTTITLTSAANWKVTAGASSHWRNIIFWDYIDAGGKAWPAETYSRNFLSDAYADGGITGNVITLKVPYAGTARAAGTSLSNGGSGGTYIYSGMSNTLVVPEWTNYKSATPITGLHDPTGGVIGGDPTSATASWPQGTATTKVAFLMNRTVAAPSNNPNARQSFAGISLSDASAAQVTADRKITTFYQAGVPTALSIGDLWVDTDDGNKLYRALSVGANAITAGEWVSVQDTAIAAAATAASTAQSAANAAQSAAATAQATADGATVTYYASTFPWANSSGQVSSKEGDLFFDTDDKTVWRWSHSTQTWVQIKDPDISAALSAAQNAQTTADGKITAYYQTSAPAGAETGDLWYDTDDQNKPYYWDGDSWELIRDGGVTTALSQITSLTTDLNNLETSVDGKTTTYFSDNAPWANGTAGHEVDAGDLWFDTNDKNKMYRWVEPGKTWTLSDDQRISETLVIANGKITTFYQAAVPTSTATGDLWVDTDDGNKLYRAAMVGANEITAGEWVSAQDAGIAAASSAASAAQSTANAAQTAAATAQATADGATVTYYASTFPWANSSGQVSSKEGDLFFDTDDKTVWRWSHSTQTWVQIKDPDITAALSAAQNAQTTADGKITAYYQAAAPVGAETGDIWYDTDDQNKPYYWDGDSWELIRDTGVTTALSQIATITTDLNNLETSVDGKATTYFSNTSPWANGATGHEVDAGDLWFDTDDKNKMYRWVEPGKTWTLSDDQRISETITLASGKITTFYQTTPPTSTTVGDLWVDTDDNNKLYRALMVGANEITAGEWVLIQDSAGALSAANTALTTANGKNKVIYSTATPGSTANTIGDVWFQRDSVTGNIIKHFEGLGGTSWTLRELSHETIASIDIGKATVGELQGQFIAGDAIDGKTITSAVIRTADSPTRVQIDADGLTQWVNDVVVTKIGETNLFTGDIDATTMQIQDQLALRGVNNIFAKGSKVTLQSNQTAPNQPLSLTVSYEEATAPGSLYYATVGAHLDASELNPAYAGNLLGQGVFRRGANYYSWPTITLPNGSTRSSYEVSRYTRIFYGGVEQAVSIMAYWTTASNLPEGIYLYTHNDAGMNTSGTTAPTVTSTLRLSDFNWSHDFALGRVFDTSGTANRDKFAYAFAQKSVDDTTWSMYGAILQPNGSGGYNTVHSTSIASFPRLGTDENLTGVNYGSSSRMQFHGADQFVWVFSTNKWNYVYNLNGTVRLTDLEFPTAQSNAYRVFTIGSLSAGDFNGFRTMALQTSSHKMYRYTDITWTGDGTASDANAVWWARYRWRNKTTEATMRQTPHGPTQYVIMKKRAMLSVTSPSIPPPAAGVGATRSAPDDVWTFRYFLGKGATEPATSAMWLQSTQPGDLVTSVKLLTSPLTSGTALNAAFTAFTGSLPSEIISSDIDGFGQPLLKLAGDGSARVSALEAASLNVTAWNSADVAWTNLSNTLAVGAVQYRVKAGWVCVTVIATAATASGTTYTVTTAQLPSALRPDRNIRGACDFSGFPGTIVANSAGNILLAHNSGANRATIEGFVTWPVQ